MEELRIPGWAVVLMSTIGGAGIYWLVYLTIKTFDNEKNIAINNTNDSNVSKELHSINSRIGQMDGKIDKVMDHLMKITR